MIAELPQPTAAAWALGDLLDREWAAQSGRREPLRVTAAIREGVELMCGPQALPDSVDSPDALLDHVRDRLPLTADPWAVRLVRRLPVSSSPVAPVEVVPPVAPEEALPPASTSLALPPAAAPAPEPRALPAPRPAATLSPLPVRATFVAIAAGAASGAALDLAGVAAGALLGACAGLAGWLLGRPQ